MCHFLQSFRLLFVVCFVEFSLYYSHIRFHILTFFHLFCRVLFILFSYFLSHYYILSFVLSNSLYTILILTFTLLHSLVCSIEFSLYYLCYSVVSFSRLSKLIFPVSTVMPMTPNFIWPLNLEVPLTKLLPCKLWNISTLIDKEFTFHNVTLAVVRNVLRNQTLTSWFLWRGVRVTTLENSRGTSEILQSIFEEKSCFSSISDQVTRTLIELRRCLL